MNQLQRGKKGFQDTSQNGNWMCFRNEHHYDSSIYISPAKFLPIPHTGKCEFDFINTDRPNIHTKRPILDDEILDVIVFYIYIYFILFIIKVMVLSRLLDDDEYLFRAIRMLNELSVYARKSALSTGATIWKPDMGTAQTVGYTSYSMYSSIPSRKESYRKCSQREAMRISAAQVEVTSPVLNRVASGTE